MRTAIYGILTASLFFALNSCFSFDNNARTFEVKLRQNDRIIDTSENWCTIADNKFEILVTNETKKNIHIFAYHNNEMFNKYTYPIKCEDTVIFHPAAFLIDNADENGEITLTINKEMQYNVITPPKRIDDNGISIIKIKDIADTDDKFNGTLYLTIFIDLNNNNIIESNEIQNISVFINKERDSILFRARIYISTMGSRISDINYPVYKNDYFYVKITSEAEKQNFLLLFGESNFINTHSTINRIVNLDYAKYNMYVIFSPITTEIELYGNPYRYTGENRIIFETRINKEANRGRYVYCREYRVEKNNDRFELWLYNNGALKRINELRLNQ
jgi:hypothetical protein